MVEQFIVTETENLPPAAAEILSLYKEAMGKSRYKEAVGDCSMQGGYQIEHLVGENGIEIIKEKWSSHGKEDTTSRVAAVDSINNTVGIVYIYALAGLEVTKKTIATPSKFCQTTQIPRFLIRGVFLPSVATDALDVSEGMDYWDAVSEIIEAKITKDRLEYRVIMRCGPVDTNEPQTIEYPESTLFTNELWEKLSRQRRKQDDTKLITARKRKPKGNQEHTQQS